MTTANKMMPHQPSDSTSEVQQCTPGTVTGKFLFSAIKHCSGKAEPAPQKGDHHLKQLGSVCASEQQTQDKIMKDPHKTMWVTINTTECCLAGQNM